MTNNHSLGSVSTRTTCFNDSKVFADWKQNCYKNNIFEKIIIFGDFVAIVPFDVEIYSQNLTLITNPLLTDPERFMK